MSDAALETFPVAQRDEAPDLGLWVSLIRLRTQAMGHIEERAWVQAALDSLNGPSIYEQVCADLGMVPHD